MTISKALTDGFFLIDCDEKLQRKKVIDKKESGMVHTLC